MSATKPTNLTFDVPELENRVNTLARELNVNPAEWCQFMGYLEELKRHNLMMYAHSLRVGIYAQGIARQEKWRDIKLAFFGGCGHDYGKCLVPNRVLNAKHYDDKKYEQVKEHTYKGFEGLKDKFLFTAFIAGLHHKYQLGGKSHYGIDLERDSPIPLNKQITQTINRAAQLVALCDFFDALTTRKNDKGLVKTFGDENEAKQLMLEHFGPWSDRVNWLFEHRIQ